MYVNFQLHNIFKILAEKFVIKRSVLWMLSFVMLSEPQ